MNDLHSPRSYRLSLPGRGGSRRIRFDSTAAVQKTGLSIDTIARAGTLPDNDATLTAILEHGRFCSLPLVIRHHGSGYLNPAPAAPLGADKVDVVVMKQLRRCRRFLTAGRHAIPMDVHGNLPVTIPPSIRSGIPGTGSPKAEKRPWHENLQTGKVKNFFSYN